VRLLKYRFTRLQAGVSCLPVAWLLLLLSAAAVADEELSYNFAPVDPPRSVPDFSLPDMDAELHALQDYRGKVVLINFWATWCPPCRREMPALEQLYNKLGDEAFAVLAINQWEDADHVFAYMGDLNVIPSFPILFDPESKISEEFGVKGLPTSFLLDRQGRVVFRAVGGRAFDHPQVEQTIRSLLAAE
jgi:thiol-disulfide isomerase/thioredoxin